jgi:H+/gluconate symporter-like permease
LLHRIAVMSAGSLDTLPHNGAVVTLLSVCGVSHREGYFDIFMVCALIAIAAVIVLGSAFGSF